MGALFIWTEWLTKNLENLEINFWSLPEKDKFYLVLIAKRWLFSLVYVPWKEDSGSASRVIFPAVNHPDTLWDFRRSQCVCWPSGSSGFWGGTSWGFQTLKVSFVSPSQKLPKSTFFFPICFWSKVWNQPIFFSPRKFSGGKKTVEISFRFCVKGHSTRIFQCYAGGDWREGAMMRRACRRFFFEIWQGNVVSLPDIWRCNHWRFTLNICKFHQASKITRFFYFLVSFYKNRVAPKKARLGSFAGSLCWCCCQWNPEIHEDVETDACGWPFWRPGNMNPRCWVFTRSNLMAGTIQQLIWHVPWDMQAWPSRTLSFSHLGQQIH